MVCHELYFGFPSTLKSHILLWSRKRVVSMALLASHTSSSCTICAPKNVRQGGTDFISVYGVVVEYIGPIHDQDNHLGSGAKLWCCMENNVLYHFKAFRWNFPAVFQVKHLFHAGKTGTRTQKLSSWHLLSQPILVSSSVCLFLERPWQTLVGVSASWHSELAWHPIDSFHHVCFCRHMLLVSRLLVQRFLGTW